MAETKSVVRRRGLAGLAGLGTTLLFGLILFLPIPGCTPLTQGALAMTEIKEPGFDPQAETFTSFDGAELGLTVWEASEGNPEIVIVGVHGMNDWANAFFMAAPW